MKKNMYIKIMILLIFIFPITISHLEIYVGGIVAIPFIIFVNWNYTVKNINKMKFILLEMMIIFYSIYILVITLIINKQYFFVSLNKVIVLFLFLSLIKYFSNTNNEEEMLNYVMYSTILIVTIGALLYTLGVDGFRLSLKPSILRGTYSIIDYNERRMVWCYEHKMQVSSMCLISFYLLINNKNISKLKKVIFMSLLTVGIILSNSKMALVYLILMAIYYIVKYVKISIKRSKFTYINAILLLYTPMIMTSIILSAQNVFSNISQTRDIYTLGGRTLIWNLAIEDIKSNPYGIIKAYGTTLNNGQSIFMTAHNLILNEMIETGILGGLIYLIIFILIYSFLRKSKDKLIFLIIILIAQFDYLISGMFSYMFFFAIAGLIVKSNKDNITNKITIDRKALR